MLGYRSQGLPCAKRILGLSLGLPNPAALFTHPSTYGFHVLEERAQPSALRTLGDPEAEQPHQKPHRPQLLGTDGGHAGPLCYHSLAMPRPCQEEENEKGRGLSGSQGRLRVAVSRPRSLQPKASLPPPPSSGRRKTLLPGVVLSAPGQSSTILSSIPPACEHKSTPCHSCRGWAGLGR